MNAPMRVNLENGVLRVRRQTRAGIHLRFRLCDMGQSTQGEGRGLAAGAAGRAPLGLVLGGRSALLWG